MNRKKLTVPSGTLGRPPAGVPDKRDDREARHSPGACHALALSCPGGETGTPAACPRFPYQRESPNGLHHIRRSGSGRDCVRSGGSHPVLCGRAPSIGRSSIPGTPLIVRPDRASVRFFQSVSPDPSWIDSSASAESTSTGGSIIAEVAELFAIVQGVLGK